MPALPATYAVLSARPDHLALAPHLTLRPKAVWLLYLGQNHARSDSGALDLHEPRTLADCGDHRVLGTAHGVIALDRTRGKYAWLYVSPGGHKLRWPSIRAARCVDRRVEVVLAEGPADEPGVRPATLLIDLDSGQVRSNDAPADREPES